MPPGPTSEFLRYVDESPVIGGIGHATEGAKASGSGKLQLKLTVPLGKGGTRVAGSYQFIANELRFPEIPALAKVNGRIYFTEQEIGTQDVAFEALGGPAKLTIANADGAVRVDGSGMADLTKLRDELDLPLMGRVSGTTDWEVSLTARGESVLWTVGSSLKGAVVDLPAPAGKTAAEIAPLKIERHEVAGRPREDLVTADYRGQVRVVAHRGSTAGNVPDRVLVQLGKAGAAPPAPTLAGIAVRGQLPVLDLDAWLKLYAGERPQGGTGAAAKAAPELNRGGPRCGHARGLRPGVARFQGHGAARVRGLGD